MTSAQSPGTGRPAPPPPLADPRLCNIYYGPDSAISVCAFAAELLAGAGGEHTVEDVWGSLPHASQTIVRKYITTLASAGYFTVRTADRARSNPPRCYRLTPQGETGLREYLHYYMWQLEELDSTLGHAGILRPRPRPGRPGSGGRPVAAPQLTPGGTRILLHFYENPELWDDLAPCPLSEIGAAAFSTTGVQGRRLRYLADWLVNMGWLVRAKDPRKGKREFSVSLTPPGRHAFPASAARLRSRLSVMHQAADDALAETGLEAGA